MKRSLMCLFVALMSAGLFAVEITVADQNEQILISRSNDSGFDFSVALNKLSTQEIKTEKGVFNRLLVPSYTLQGSYGTPSLPLIRKIISVPLEANLKITVLKGDYKEFYLKELGIMHPLLPAQPSLSKSVNPSDVNFVYDERSYQQNSFTDLPLVRTEENGILRGLRLVNLDISPVVYNPATQKIRVYSNIEARVDFINADYAATDNLRAKTLSADFEALYSQVVWNYSLSAHDRDALSRYPMKYLIVCYDQFMSAMAPFVEWKRQSGYDMTMVSTATAGTSTSAIKSYIQNIWNNATPDNPAPTYLLIVGDTPQVPVFSGTTESHVTDLTYVLLQGTDLVPEMYYGRFSANNLTELTPQIEKTLYYEKGEFSDPSYLGHSILIAGVDATYGPTHANGQINYASQQYFNTAHGQNPNIHLYPNSGSQSTQIISEASSGVGFINYTAHGDWDSWYEPSFTISNVNSLQNANKYSFVIGNCCLTNKFETSTCFGEAWLRAANKGAVGYIGGTNSTLWDEDYWWAVGNGQVVSGGATYEQTGLGMYDALFHSHSENYNDWATTAGAMIFRGNLAVTAGNGDYNYYWEIYSLMGDPSLSPYTKQPEILAGESLTTLFLGMNSLSVQSVPYAYLCLSRGTEIIATKIAEADGSANLTFDNLTEVGDITLTITAQNYLPLVRQIAVVPNEGAYIVTENYLVYDDNNNQIENNETVHVNLELGNIGVLAVDSLQVTAYCEDEYITLLPYQGELLNIEAGSSVDVANALVFTTAANTPDQHQVTFNLNYADGENSWSGRLVLTINAPQLAFGEPSFTNSSSSDGAIHPGDLLSLQIPVTNTGHARITDILANITNLFTDKLTLNYLPNIEELDAGSTLNIYAGVQVSEIAQEGENYLLGFLAASGDYSAHTTYNLHIGPLSFMEDFETGAFTLPNWNFSTEDAGWQVITGGAYNGNYSAKSATITHNQAAAMQIVVASAAASTVSFARKVSSESGYDFLRFYINGNQTAEWSGTQAWAVQTYDLQPGTNTLKWAYEKDNSYSSGSDCAWIDNITLPVAGGAAVTTGMLAAQADTVQFGLLTNLTTAEKTLKIFNIGNADITVSAVTEAPFLIYGVTENITLAPNEFYIFNLGFTPTENGEYRGTLVISSNEQTVNLPLHGELSVVGANEHNNLFVNELKGNYPNPFNPVTNIRFTLEKAQHVNLSIYNIKGQLVKTLTNENRQKGEHLVVWNGTDNAQRKVASGIYFYKLHTDTYTSVKKMLMIK